MPNSLVGLMSAILDDGESDWKNVEKITEGLLLDDAQKKSLIKIPFLELKYSSSEKEKREWSFDDISVSQLRESISTFNNLVVRLPSGNWRNNLISRNIFNDWTAFVEGSVKSLVGKNLLFQGENYSTGVGTDGVKHQYKELYVDEAMLKPLIDYSYCVDKKTGEIIHDRWDYWSEKDFM